MNVSVNIYWVREVKSVRIMNVNRSDAIPLIKEGQRQKG